MLHPLRSSLTPFSVIPHTSLSPSDPSVLTFETILLALYTAFEDWGVTQYCDINHKCHDRCRFASSPIIPAVMLGSEVVFLVVGALLAYTVSRIDENYHNFSESKSIALVVYNYALISTCLAPVLFGE